MKIIVVGAGIIGALTAFRLTQQGAEVVVIDAAQPASAASGASFGWINASFYANKDHFALRYAAMAAHKSLAQDLNSRAHTWAGCLCWETEGDAFIQQYRDLSELGYDVEIVDRTAFSELEPYVAAPERALRFRQEGAVDLPTLARDALKAAAATGAQIITGVPVTGLATEADKIQGVQWAGGVITAEKVVLAAGVKTQILLAEVGVSLPMLDRPGLILRSGPLPPLLSHILVSPGQELRQQVDGRILAPTTAAHQQDTTERVSQNPAEIADEAIARVSGLLQRDVAWEEISLAHRPVPGDGLPVMGHCGPKGLYVATMHSGATLAPLAADLAALEIMHKPLANTQADLIAPYRPDRFTT